MVEKPRSYPHNEVTDCLEKILHAKGGYDVRKNLEDFPKLRRELKTRLPIDPRLPVDLICANKVQEETATGTKKSYWHYTLFLVNSTEKISKSLQNRLRFYQFYLSGIKSIEPSRLMIVAAIPHQFDLAQKDIEFFEENGFGLWKIDTDTVGKSEVVGAKNLRDHMIEEFQKAIRESKKEVPKELKKWLPIIKISREIEIAPKKLKDAISERAQDFILFFEEYILDAVESIAGMSPEQFGKRYIDREILNSALKLENISYQDELFRLINSHLTEKVSDYDFSKGCFQHLWKINFKEDYPLTLKKFELLLQQFFPTYREHFIHQLQVFLLGTIILSHLFKNPRNLFETSEIDDKEKVNIHKGWLLASSIHDFTYPLQKYDEWSEKFFKEQLNIDRLLSFLELKNIYVEEDFSACTENILSKLKSDFIDSDSWERDKLYNAIRRFCYYEKTEKKNHGLMASFYLQKKFKKEIKFNREFQEKILQPAAVAVAMHDNEIWQILSGQINGSREQRWKFIAEILGIKESKEDVDITNCFRKGQCKDKQIADTLRETRKKWVGDIYIDISNITKKKPISKLRFKSEPLTFLLILIDNLQDYGRPCEDEERKKGMEAADIRLKEIVSDKNCQVITIRLYFSRTEEESMGFIKNKIEILKKIEKFLRSPDTKFLIEYWDRENGKKAYSFKIN